MKSAAFLVAIVVSFFSSKLHGQDEIDHAVAKAIPWLEEETRWWIEEKECVSCHHTTFSVWARELALTRGLNVDPENLKKDREWIFQQFTTPREPDPERPDDVVKEGEVNGDRNVEGVAQFLVSLAGEKINTEQTAKLKEIISRNKTGDGIWKPGGQLPLQKRPKHETSEISGIWANLALGAKADTNLSDAKTTEWYAMQAIASGNSESLSRLIQLQNEDGGWSWIAGEPSDPTGTGQALLAIGRVGEGDYETIVEKARTWLLSNQLENGTWKTYSTKRRNRSGRVSNFWGTSWALIGLMESKGK